MKKNMKIFIGLSIVAVTAGAAYVAYELFKKRLHTGCIYGGCHDENLDGIPEDYCGEDISGECIDYVDICPGETVKAEEPCSEETCDSAVNEQGNEEECGQSESEHCAECCENDSEAQQQEETSCDSGTTIVKVP